jgi:hypothetical protein
MKECMAKHQLGNICRGEEACEGKLFVNRMIKTNRYREPNDSAVRALVKTCEGCVNFRELNVVSEIPELVAQQHEEGDTITL